MPGGVQSLIDVAVAVLAFGLVLALALLGAYLWLVRKSLQKRRLEKRLGFHDQGGGRMQVLRLWKDGEEATTTVPYLSRRWSLARALDRLRHEAGWEVPAYTVTFGLVGVLALLLLIALALTGSAVAGLATTIAGLAIFWTYLKQQIAKWSARFDRQLVDALDLAARSLRAGYPLIGAFRLVAEEVAPPAGIAFADICQHQTLGVPLEEALQYTAARSSSADMELFATSVVIQIRSGGNLADMMDQLAAVIRERIRLSGRVRVLTAQTQFSKRVLIALPFVMFGLLSLINPHYLQPLYESSIGKIMLAAAAGVLLTGAWVMNKMAVLRY